MLVIRNVRGYRGSLHARWTLACARLFQNQPIHRNERTPNNLSGFSSARHRAPKQEFRSQGIDNPEPSHTSHPSDLSARHPVGINFSHQFQPAIATTIISPTATINEAATIDTFVNVDDYSHIGSHAFIGRFSEIGKHVYIDSHVQVMSGGLIGDYSRIGAHTRLFPHAIVGYEPQDRKYQRGPTKTEIGSHVVIREHCRIERGTEGGGGVTRVGDHCLIMSGCYIGHDCMIEPGCNIAVNTSLAGHVHLEKHTNIGGHSAIHQFVRIGEASMIGAMSAIRRSVIPFTVVSGNPARLRSLNYKKLWPRLGFYHRRLMFGIYKHLFACDSSYIGQVCGWPKESTLLAATDSLFVRAKELYNEDFKVVRHMLDCIRERELQSNDHSSFPSAACQSSEEFLLYVIRSMTRFILESNQEPHFSHSPSMMAREEEVNDDGYESIEGVEDTKSLCGAPRIHSRGRGLYTELS